MQVEMVPVTKSMKLQDAARRNSPEKEEAAMLDSPAILPVLEESPEIIHGGGDEEDNALQSQALTNSFEEEAMVEEALGPTERKKKGDVNNNNTMCVQEVKAGDKCLWCQWCEAVKTVDETVVGHSKIRVDAADDNGGLPVDLGLAQKVARKLKIWSKMRGHCTKCCQQPVLQKNKDLHKECDNAVNKILLLDRRFPPGLRQVGVKCDVDNSTKDKKIHREAPEEEKLWQGIEKHKREVAFANSCQGRLNRANNRPLDL